jgi:hypothetical protein
VHVLYDFLPQGSSMVVCIQGRRLNICHQSPVFSWHRQQGGAAAVEIVMVRYNVPVIMAKLHYVRFVIIR